MHAKYIVVKVNGQEVPLLFPDHPATWAQHMPGMPFARAVQERPALACALKHIAWISAALEASGVPATPFNVAAAWNSGLDCYIHGRAPVRAYRYARDVEQIYEHLRAVDPARVTVTGPSVCTTDERPPASPVEVLRRVCLPSTDHRADRLKFNP